MRRSRLPAVMLATLPAFAVQEASAGEPDGRYPVWPTELDRIAAPLRDPTSMSESARIAALGELSEFASEVILPDLELALTDPSPEVRKIALQLCAQRELVECIDEAETMWAEGEGGVRLMALELLSREPTPERLALIFEAMEDSSDLVREQALLLLVQAPLDDEQAKQARAQIVGQLGDISARVKRTAAQSLGQLGPGEGGLALVRLLEDMDRNVAYAAAVSLGQLADPRTGPALQRALESPFDSNFAGVVVEALAQLPGEDIERFLLEQFDTPPRNLRRLDVAKAMGRRAQPGTLLIAGLVERMRDEDLRAEAINALLWLGERAVPQLEAAAARGLEPDIALEGALAWQLERGAAATQVRPWLAALALARAPILDAPEHVMTWSKVALWAHEQGASAESRCLASLALGRAEGTRHAELVRDELRALTAAHLADVRGCAALALARFGEDPVFEPLLADPSARVRAATALAVGQLRRPSAQLRARLALQSDRDTEMRARTSAAAALAGAVEGGGVVSFIRGARGSAGGSTVISHWTRFELDGREIDVPMLGGGRGWAIVPLTGFTAAPVEASPILAQPYRYNYYDYYRM